MVKRNAPFAKIKTCLQCKRKLEANLDNFYRKGKWFTARCRTCYNIIERNKFRAKAHKRKKELKIATLPIITRGFKYLVKQVQEYRAERKRMRAERSKLLALGQTYNEDDRLSYEAERDLKNCKRRKQKDLNYGYEYL